MNNCLVKKYNVTVSNSDLRKFGVLEVFANAGTVYFNAKADTANKCILKIVDNVQPFTPGGTVIDETSRYITTSGGVITLKSIVNTRQMKLELTEKYNITSIENVGVYSLEDIVYMPLTLCVIKGGGTEYKYDLADLDKISDKTKLTTFRLDSTSENNQIVGSLSILKLFTNLTDIQVSRSVCTGNISELSNLTSLTKLNFFNSPSIIGSINSLAALMVTGGRTSGTLEITGNGVITYLVNNEETTFTGKKTITFDSSLPEGYSIA
jgi:hypothetical protein